MNRVPLSLLPDFVRQVIVRIPHDKKTAVLIALRGDLGAGKTTFVQTFGRELGIEETIQSPTYVLMKKYSITHPVFKTLVHIDAYRLQKPEEFLTLKPDVFLNDPENLVVVEWPERLGFSLPAADLTINFSSDGADTGERYIEIKNEPR